MKTPAGFLRVCFCLALLLLGAEAHAADEYVRCVQKQLIALGQAPGPADGLLGPRTRSAARSLKLEAATSQVVQGLPDLSAGSAREWCSALSAHNPDLASFQPAAMTTRVMAEGVAGDVAQELLEVLLNDVALFFEERYDIKPERQPVVVAADSSFEMARLMREQFATQNAPAPHILALVLAQHARRVCHNGEGVGGVTYRDVIGLCWTKPKDATPSGLARWARREKLEIGTVLAHEYMHHVQFLLLGEAEEFAPNLEAEKEKSPRWITEGSATYVGVEYKVRRGANLRRLTLRELQDHLRGTDPVLTGLGPTGPEAFHYTLSLFAIELLAQRSGDGALFEYWRSIGEGKDHEQAFMATFGMSLDDFETRFPDLLKSRSAARDFAKGGQ